MSSVAAVRVMSYDFQCFVFSGFLVRIILSSHLRHNEPPSLFFLYYVYEFII